MVCFCFSIFVRTAHPQGTQPWYVDGSGAGVTLAGIQAHTMDLVVRVPPQGYLPDLTKIILVVSPRNILQLDAYFCELVLRVVTGSIYLDGFIGDPAM